MTQDPDEREEQIRQEYEHTLELLRNARITPEARKVLEALKSELHRKLLNLPPAKPDQVA